MIKFRTEFTDQKDDYSRLSECMIEHLAGGSTLANMYNKSHIVNLITEYIGGYLGAGWE